MPRDRKAKVEIPMMVDDARFAPLGRPEATEPVRIEEDVFLDGPVTRRVAVLDFNPDTGALEPGAVYLPPKRGNVLGHYQVPDPPDVTSRAFNQVSVFATVYKTIQMFEQPDTLGREIRWAFDAPQLFVVPRAGQTENAQYERDTHSLQFFYFPSHQDGTEIVYTSLARDIVAHETGHAILDGIAPHLWNAITPQCLALHEAIGDLSALLVSIESNQLRRTVLEKTEGSIQDSTHFSALAEQFGMAKSGRGALRTLLNDLKVSQVERSGPHKMCQVLTGALYTVLIKMHEDRKLQRMKEVGGTPKSVSGYALAVAADQFRRMTLRALDYLPPGEISFADYGRAIIAADQASHPDDPEEREWMVEEFVRRGMAPDRAALQVDPPPRAALRGIDLKGLATSDWAAYDFANSARGRALLSIPKGVQFQVEPRLNVEKAYYHRRPGGGYQVETVREVLVKVWWWEGEENAAGLKLPGRRQIAVGSTLAWDRDTGVPRVLLTSSRSQRPEEGAEQQADRNLYLRWLVEEGYLRPGRGRLGPDGRPPRLAVDVGGTDRLLRVRNVARMLHLTSEEER